MGSTYSIQDRNEKLRNIIHKMQKEEASRETKKYIKLYCMQLSQFCHLLNEAQGLYSPHFQKSIKNMDTTISGNIA